jgi:hypothetical protein
MTKSSLYVPLICAVMLAGQDLSAQTSIRVESNPAGNPLNRCNVPPGVSAAIDPSQGRKGIEFQFIDDNLDPVDISLASANVSVTGVTPGIWITKVVEGKGGTASCLRIIVPEDLPSGQVLPGRFL